MSNKTSDKDHTTPAIQANPHPLNLESEEMKVKMTFSRGQR